MLSKMLGIVILIIYSSCKVETAEEETDLPFVVSFIYKELFPVTALCSGAILTEKLILSAAYPILVMPKGQHCVLPGFNKLTVLQEYYIEKYCIDIHKFHRADYSLNLVIVELNRTIFFKWSISTVKLIIPKDITTFTYNHSCFVPGWKYKKSIPGPGVPLTEMATELIAHKVAIEGVENQYATLKPLDSSDFYLCNAHIGMPLLCDYFMVGIVANADLNGNIECKTYPSFSYINIMTPEVQEYLQDIIPMLSNLKMFLALKS